ncbi:hypothetical protein [Bacillus cytotoxicus]|nr:hypothetical protein [Bacillus cytotoxicus]MDH2859627.1 hypothetical protein [Bacillus cytotoxicus]MDH2867680.1 hypothetical protein [Bacillus cytotoxicus]MDH2871952.1 hypothetical protein [Bacillus cytotoxicus]MDH2876383.1 hypothetical protein [Bacillus cytotoxicus]MDH2886801.1 hypothetical protein [Bacillus cytotoxicus]
MDRTKIEAIEFVANRHSPQLPQTGEKKRSFEEKNQKNNKTLSYSKFN